MTKLRKLLDAAKPYWAPWYGRLLPALDLSQATPVLVLGNQKTGSSAIAHLLAARGALSLAADVHPAQGREAALAGLDEPEIRTFIQGPARYYFGHDVVKENALTAATDVLLATLPAARGVFVVRHPAQNIRSLLDRLGLPGDPRPLGPLAAQLSDEWREVVAGAARHGERAPEDHITALAQRWSAMARLYRRNEDRLHRARYEDFMAGKAPFIHRLAEVLGLPQKRNIEPLLDVSFQPRGAHRGTAPGDFFSSEALHIIEATCTTEAHALDYPSAVAS